MGLLLFSAVVNSFIHSSFPTQRSVVDLHGIIITKKKNYLTNQRPELHWDEKNDIQHREGPVTVMDICSFLNNIQTSFRGEDFQNKDPLPPISNVLRIFEEQSI